ncbi:GNAT family N-acetyltransferase [Lactobacillus sp. Sy-1]|uniref:GNAT family N-acetyltransferase n=1 Tax=Lactobacillus sp. Sy-1 TaxID=2109645 RepID=UPI001C5A931F|nr:GNAT family N-acetyltransferase [Lactobacillus sp. Sy-1]MBW1606053.1 GNAT family N-acetyltransferase [Lactobacillus sp. Sy-1]
MAAIYVRRGMIHDIPEIMKIINAAKKRLRAEGNPQWQAGYPSNQSFETDINNRVNYVLIVDGKVAGTASLLTAPDVYYQHIDGSWHDDRHPYATLHRMAIDGHYAGMHLGSYLISNLITIATMQGIHNLRFDTHRTNQRMQLIGKRSGFTERGIIKNHDPNDAYRVAFELNL